MYQKAFCTACRIRTRRTRRPDMLLAEDHTGDDVLPTPLDLEHPRHRRCCRIHVVEVGLCTEFKYAQKCKEKYEQHCTLLDFLKNTGYADFLLHLLIFGSTRGMFKLKAWRLKRLTRLGVPQLTGDSLLQNMHSKALRKSEQIVGRRRRLEHDSSQEIRGPLANKRKHGTYLGWGLMCLIACWAPPSLLMPVQPSLFRSGVSLDTIDGPLKGHSLWDLALQ